ncbi:MAG: hypothetical protein J5374_01540 [Bacteroidales bacterium]|nr:hypothetical protein [Bacteroidales bacterium]
MTQLRPNILISDAYGSAGDVTAYHRGGKCFLRKRITPVYAGTVCQQASMSVHLRALQAWRSLSHEEQLRWAPYAERVEPHRPPFDHKARISGNNLFISAYHGFATLGREHIPEPQPFEAFPMFLVGILGASAANGTLTIRLRLEAEDHAGRYRLLAKIQLSRPGSGRNPGAMRNYLASGTANDPFVTVLIPDYTSVWSLDLPSYQLHSRCILLDTKTGYRSQFLAVSGIVSL